jgi:tRNA 2-selenouridine synthase
MKEIGPEEFLQLAGSMPVIDVRSPSEYEKGHIPGAFNLPLFNDDERARVGTTYKKNGRSPAFDLGLDIVGPKMSGYVREARKLAPGKQLLVHCWRGGMRSASMGWLMETAGFRVNVLVGGYKAYRSHVRENLAAGRRFIILGGLTGSGKTLWLNDLAAAGEAVVDLEKLASHRGSVFGGIGLADQPTNEQFENDLFRALEECPAGEVIWLEDESRRIGKIYMPEPFYLAMVDSPLVRIRVDKDLRTRIILDEYAGLDTQRLAASIRQISKRLGGLVTARSLELLVQGDYRGVVEQLLPYYDKTYSFSVESRNRQVVYDLDLTGVPTREFAARLIEKKGELIQ